jgi:superfamily I DNA/RNA helicase
MAFQPSPQQQVFFNWITNDTGSCLVEAVAGSGKTTTLIEGLKLMSGSIFFGAYNKKISEEIQAKAPDISSLKISTMHAAGFGIWRMAAKGVQVDQDKCQKIFRDLVPEKDWDLQSAVLQLVSLAKQSAFGALFTPSHSHWTNLIDHFSVDCLDQEEKAIEWAKTILSASIKMDTESIDFDDMILAPLIHKCRCKQYDWVLIDEAQDTNAARRALALMMLKRGGRLVAVGDPHQAIYGFTGADSDALDLIAKAVSAKRIPLTVSYRCPKSVTELARTWVNHIESHPSAPEGKVFKTAKHDDLFDLVMPGDAVLCRFNAPTIQIAYQLIFKGIPARIEGRDIGKNLKALARRWKVKSPSVFLDRLTDWEQKETTKLRMRQKESLAAAVEDKVHCLQVLVSRVLSLDPECKDIVSALCGEIDSLFGDNVGGAHVLLSSIHKSKGREWSRVFWIQTPTPKWCRKDWEFSTEVNLSYVAATRAKSELYLVPMAPREEK